MAFMILVGNTAEARPMGSISVENERGESVRVFIDDRLKVTLRPGTKKRIAVTVGRHEVVLRGREGTILERHSMVISTNERASVVAEADTGRLVVHNTLPISVEVSTGNRTRMLSSYSQAVFEDVPTGKRSVIISRPSGQLIEKSNPKIRAGRTTTLQVAEPNTGLVTFNSDSRVPVRVYVDGLQVAKIDSFDNRTIETDTGVRHIVVRDTGGRVILDARIYVTPFDTGMFSFRDLNDAVSERHTDNGYHVRPSEAEACRM